MGIYVPLELQSERHECGLACLAMVAGYYDKYLDLAGLRQKFFSSGKGLTLGHIGGFAQQLGLMTRGLRAEPEHLRQIKTPAILHWNLDHFVVLVNVKRKGCVVHDPAEGRKFVSWAQVSTNFTGIVMEVWPGVDFTPSAKPTEHLNITSVWRMLGKSGKSIAWVFALSFLLQLMVLMGPWHVQWTVDEALMTGDVHLIGVLALGFGLVVMLRQFTFWLRGVVIIHLGHHLSFQLASRLLRHLLHLPLHWYERRHVGDITSRFASLLPVRNLLTQGAAAALVDLLMVLLSLVVMLVYSVQLGLVVVAVQLVASILQFSFVPQLKQLSLSAVVAQASEQTHLLESTRSVHSVKVYCQENVRFSQWQKRHAKTLDVNMTLLRTQLGVASLTQFIGGLELVTIIYLGAHMVLDGAFTVGMLFAFVSYRSQFAERLSGLVGHIVEFRTLQVHLNRLGEIWCEETELESSGSNELTALPIQSISLSAVGYRYDDSQPWLYQGLNLCVSPGEFVAIVGPSGHGKSTLLKLLMGLVAPTNGQLLLGDVMLGRPTYGDYRQHIGCVLQQDGFFTGTVVENIAMFEVADLQRVHSVVEAVGMHHDLTSLPLGYATQIGDIGSGFSSGQMQRLLLARALYKEPNYLFLDEGTANLDGASARQIHELVNRLHCTRVIVTHDLAFAACADACYSLQDGQLVPINVDAAMSNLGLETQ